MIPHSYLVPSAYTMNIPPPSSKKSRELQTNYSNMLASSLICLMMSNICRKKSRMFPNNPCYPSDMYDSSTVFVIDNSINNTYTSLSLIINCKKYNFAVLLNTPDDLVYLYQLVQRRGIPYHISNWFTSPKAYRNTWLY